MNEVFEKTRELGEALLKSEEYKTLKQAEQKAMADKQAAEALGRYMEKRGEMEEMLRANEKDWAKVQKLTEEIDECRRVMDDNESIVALENAKGVFSELINQINTVLRFIVTGEMETGEACGGDCSSCGGCGAKVN